MNLLEKLLADPRKTLEPGAVVRFRFLSFLVQGTIVSRAENTDPLLYTIEEEEGGCTTIQPWYAIAEVIEHA